MARSTSASTASVVNSVRAAASARPTKDKTPVAAAAETVVAKDEAEDSRDEAAMFSMFMNMFGGGDVTTPIVSFKRGLAAWIIGLAASFCTGYLVGIIFNIIVAAAALTVGGFVWWMLFVIAVIVAAWGGMKVGAVVQNAVRNGTIEKSVGAAFTGTRNFVGGLFGRKADVVAA